MAKKKNHTPAKVTPQEPVVQPIIEVPADTAVIVPENEPTPTPEVIEDIAKVPAEVNNTGATPIDSTVGDEEPAPPVPTGNEVVSAQPAKPTYTVEEADLNAHPELDEQGVKHNDEVEYGSKWVNKYDTAQKDSFHREPWPAQIEIVRNGISFKE